ncbi:MAG: energy-coupling factor transporter transmembrane protein EcfT [Treponemataceae bacterium]|nr:energy-coupling factor transporter transmembrane protein EcfT [Treponemataceae bacterium]
MKPPKIRARTPALFSYRNENSIVHRMPAGVKILLLCVISVRTFSNAAFGLGGAPSAVPPALIPWLRTAVYGITACAAFFAARTPAASLKKLAFVPVLGVCVAAASLIPSSADGFRTYQLNVGGLLASLLYTFRFLVTATAALIVFETTSRLQIYDALEGVEDCAARICPPVRRLRLAQTLSITISFIPEIFSAWNAVSLAARARSPRRPKKRARLRNAVRTASAECAALLFNLLHYAEDTRRAVANREPPAER